MKKRILIAGGAGFIGSHLVGRLLSDGHQITCVDDFSTGRRCNIEAFLPNENFKLIEHDICVQLKIEVDEIYNLACPASPKQFQTRALEIIQTCVQGTLNQLELAHKQNARILQASTSEVYGDPLTHPQSESDFGNVNPIGPRACYDEGKRIAETLFFEYQRNFKTDIKVVRIFNTFGPNMDANDGRVVSNFITQALSNRDLTIYGNGDQTRSLCFISDLVDGMIRMMDSPHSGPVNLGNPIEITVLDLAEMVLRLTESHSQLVFQPLPEDDPKRRRPNIDLANSLLGWSPKIGLEEGLFRTIEHFRSFTD